MSAAAVVTLDRARARSITRKLAGAVDLALDLVVEAYEGHVWSVLGFGSWAEYVAAEVPALQVIGKGLPVERRRDTVADLRGRGLSLRGVAEVLGISAQTVMRDAGERGVQLAEVRSLDGAIRPATAAPAGTPRPKLTNVARAVLVIREAGDAGVTVHQLTRRLRLSQSATSALLSRLAGDGRITYRRPAKRGQTGSYVIDQCR